MQLSEKFSIFQFIFVYLMPILASPSEKINELINSKYNLEKITEITQ